MKSVESVLRLKGSLWCERFVKEVGLEARVKGEMVAMATSFWLSVYGSTLAPPGEYGWAVRVWRRCGLMSSYFDHLFVIMTFIYNKVAFLMPV